MFYQGQHRTFDVNMGMKISKSIYILASHETPRSKSDIIQFFMASSLEDAVREGILSDHFKENNYIYIICGDGQVVHVTPDAIKE